MPFSGFVMASKEGFRVLFFHVFVQCGMLSMVHPVVVFVHRCNVIRVVGAVEVFSLAIDDEGCFLIWSYTYSWYT